MKRVLSGLSSAVLIVLLTVTTVWAQGGATAQISGLVRDESAGILPGADVTITQTDTGFKRSVVTDAAGAFAFPNIPIGPYRLEAMLQGFRSFVQTGIVLQVNSSPSFNVTLSLGQVAETITVQGESPLIDTGKMGISQVMDNKRIVDLPLNGRNPADLLQFLPGAVAQPALNATSRSMGGSNGGLSYSLAGGLSFGVSYTLDGATHNNPYDNLNMPLPFPDALQEFRAETSALTAQNGMHSGGAVNAVTKSGTNQFRGDAFEFFRHHSLNATDPFAAKNPDGSRKDDGLKRNQYGATLGGPIKTNKLFFFAGYQGTNTRVIPTDNRAFVPTAAMLAGDFTAFASPACNGGRQINLPAALGFTGNRIDPSQFSKAALNISRQASDGRGSVRPCSVWFAKRNRRRPVRQQGRLSAQCHALGFRSLHCDQSIHAAAVQPRFGRREHAGDAHRGQRQPGADDHAGRELRDQSVHAECVSFHVQPHRHPPDEHRLLLGARGGHQHLQLHSALHAADRRHRRRSERQWLSARRRNRKQFHVHDERLADQQRSDARARCASIRVRRERGALDVAVAGKRSVARSACDRHDVDWPACCRTSCSGESLGRTAWFRRRRTRSTWRRPTSGCTVRTRGGSAPA